jgi:aspartate/methionine/tyrosine aminotransferase
MTCHGYFKEMADTLPDMEWVPPDGGMIFFPRIGSQDAGDRLYQLLLDNYQTIVTPGNLFENSEHVRIGMGEDLKDAKEGLRRFRDAYLELTR